MPQTTRTRNRSCAWQTLPLLLALCLLAASSPRAQTAAAPDGGGFEDSTLRNLNAAEDAPRFDLGSVVGNKAVILFYWIAGHERAESVFLELQALQNELGEERLALIGLAVTRPDVGADVIRERIRELGIRVPVLEDEEFRLGRLLQVRAVPNITLVDADGVVRLTNGGSLRQSLEYKIDLEAAIRRAAAGQSVVDYGFLPPYFPVRELEGQACPDFRAPLLASSVEQRWHSPAGARQAQRADLLVRRLPALPPVAARD